MERKLILQPEQLPMLLLRAATISNYGTRCPKHYSNDLRPLVLRNCRSFYLCAFNKSREPRSECSDEEELLIVQGSTLRGLIIVCIYIYILYTYIHKNNIEV